MDADPPFTDRSTGSAQTLSSAQVNQFWSQGFIGPFPSGLTPGAALRLGDRYEHIVQERTVNPLYGRHAQRDWHLVHDDLEQVLTSDPIILRSTALLGPDLLLWRSKIFHKAPGGNAIEWHQDWGYYDGEEIGNATPSLQPANPDLGPWDLTIWLALDDITHENGPLQFSAGSHTTRYSWKHVPMTESAFYEDPFQDLDQAEIINRTRKDRLLLGIDTAGWLDGLDLQQTTRDETVAHLERRFAALPAKYTEFEPAPGTLRTVTMNAGDFVIFSERTMHRSPANRSHRRRTAVNGRLTKADTLVHPGRLVGNVIDAANLDISHHTNILVAGDATEVSNTWRAPRNQPLPRP
jgi:non-heme Fe2+,alpha-ketoglutarate-dependent halogenase